MCIEGDAVEQDKLRLCCAAPCMNCSVYGDGCGCLGVSGKVRTCKRKRKYPLFDVNLCPRRSTKLLLWLSLCGWVCTVCRAVNFGHSNIQYPFLKTNACTHYKHLFYFSSVAMVHFLVATPRMYRLEFVAATWNVAASWERRVSALLYAWASP